MFLLEYSYVDRKQWWKFHEILKAKFTKDQL